MVALGLRRVYLRVAHGPNHVRDRRGQRAERRYGALARLHVAGIHQRRQHDVLAMMLGRDERHRRRFHDRGDGRKLLRRSLGRGDKDAENHQALPEG